MPVVINNQTYYMIAEAVHGQHQQKYIVEMIREGRYADVKTRDRNVALFSIEDVERLKCQVNKIEEVYTPEPHKSQ